MIWRHEGGDELVVLGSNRLTSYDPASGDEIWWAGGFPWETICVPVTGEGLLFVSSAAGGGRGEPNWDAEASWATTIENFDRDGDQVITRAEMNDGLSIPLRPELAKDEPGAFFHIEPGQVDGWLTNLDQDGDGALSKTDWLATLAGFALQSKPVLIAIRPSARGDARPSSVAWEIHTGIPEMPSPLYHQGNIYLVRNGGVLSCIKAADGSRVYRERIGAGGHYVASPIVVGEKLVTVSKRGTVTVIQVGDQLDVLATNDFGEETLATPAIAGNNLYLRTARRLYAIGE
jgi:outer membrane protein assembly factor BamB